MSEYINQTEEQIEATLTGKQDKTGNTFTVATVPSAADNVGRVIYVSDGAAGSPTGAISDGTNWKVIGTLGATIAAS